MLFIIIVTFIYAVLTGFTTGLLTSLSVPVFFSTLYILPLVINFTFTMLQKNEKYKLIYSFIFPTLAMIFYLLFAHLTSNSGTWTEFVNMNTLGDGDISVEIADNLFSIAQVSFAILVYYTFSVGTYLLMKVAKKKEMRGVTYA